ncbi:uncharacterized protein LOC127285595 [Leptopilina boulardi]|uniref:uncharacterized protein LOC127280784 n=1 Tax=Leptopilina boulardi TaxID=63433 RepID=UPI0021F57246|nr:uncharacterized protein LOC127280784 [Leptopilina boulardi]XP_051167648.1 uncharacterized protein LOC127285595 [Leptopilina boulardi]
MGDLPPDRVKPQRAFSVSGVDFAGPITTLVNKGRGRKTNKSYIAVFDCFSTKAIHLEGANNELLELYQLLETESHNSINDFCSVRKIDWSFIPPLAPHMGGLWEAGVKSCKFNLKRMIGLTLLTFEELCTVLEQIEACINSRPLYSLPSTLFDLQPLTPAHFLIGEPLTNLPDPDIKKFP